jgi:PAS domain S-box-containing protein
LAILVVDDEPQVGVALADLLEDEVRVISRTSPASAFDILKHDHSIATILCDQRMPEMRGDEFLTLAREHSSATRLLMTGYADLESVVRAVNDGQIFGYISKPWDPEGVRISVFKAIENFTLRSQLNHERALLRDLMRHSPDAIAFKDRELAYVLLNLPEAHRLGRADPAAIVGHRAGEFLPGERWQPREQRERELLRSGEVQLDEVEQVLTADGSLRWYAANTAPIHDERGEVTGLVSIARDVTEQKRAMESLRFGEAQLASAQRIAKIGSWTWDIGSGRVLLSRELARMLDRADDGEIAIAEFLRYFHEADRRNVEEALDLACRGQEALSLDCRLGGGDGDVRHVTVEGEVTMDATGEPALVVGTVHDVTESRRLQDQLRQSQKMEAVGQLTGGVAHDFNNLLTVMLGNLQLMKNHLAPEDLMSRWLNTAERAALRGGDLTKRLLAFSRQQVLEEKPTDANEVVAELEELFRRTLGGAVEIETSLGRGLWITKVDRGELENALLNLVVNARDAMDGRGKLTIETANVVLDEAYARQHFDVAPGAYVMLAVSDTGCGIAEDVLEHVFVPFFTTKEAGKGTGLGMSMVYGFIKQSNGNVEIYSEVGKGTTVKIYLPRLVAGEPVAAAAAAATAEAGRAHPSATVLVVEDEADLRDTLVGILNNLGYTTFEAADGRQALGLLQEHPEIDVLFTDYIMPNGLDGLELVQRAREINPRIKALLTSGYTRRAVLRREELGEELDWIGKPYLSQDIARKLREILD